MRHHLPVSACAAVVLTLGNFAARCYGFTNRVYVSAWSTATQELGTIDAPFRALQPAATLAHGTGADILVARGWYTSSDSRAVLNLEGATYDLTVGGGYSLDFSRRDPRVYTTVIDGQGVRRGIRLYLGQTLRLSGVAIQDGYGSSGGAVMSVNSAFHAENCSFVGNRSTTGVNEIGGALYASGGSLTLNNCWIASNIAGSSGGAVYLIGSAQLEAQNSVFVGNWAGYTGGAAAFYRGRGVFRNCVIVGNSCESQGGGIVFGPNSEGHIHECTVAGNEITALEADEYTGGGGISVSASSFPAMVTMSGSIVYRNRGPRGGDLRLTPSAESYATNCNIGEIDGSLTEGMGVISVDPLFARLEGNDVHLLYGSPCIDAGSTYHGTVGFDMDGESRPSGLAMDIGADEFTDSDYDDMADYWETRHFEYLSSSDGTGDSDHDTLDDFSEYMNQTDPNDSDTDDDLAIDGWEVAEGYDPLDRDMDGDGMWDGWEARYSLNAFINDAALNPDGDAHNNGQEFAADTNPRDSGSLLSVLKIGEEQHGVRIDWKGGVESWQWLERSTNLSNAGSWEWIAGFPPPRPLTNAILILDEPVRARFYRIRAERR